MVEAIVTLMVKSKTEAIAKIGDDELHYNPRDGVQRVKEWAVDVLFSKHMKVVRLDLEAEAEKAAADALQAAVFARKKLESDEEVRVASIAQAAQKPLPPTVVVQRVAEKAAASAKENERLSQTQDANKETGKATKAK